jgi:hypothetical protein
MMHAMSTPASCDGSGSGPARPKIAEFATCLGPFPLVSSGRTYQGVEKLRLAP